MWEFTGDRKMERETEREKKEGINRGKQNE
jgi:hypothetical protein